MSTSATTKGMMLGILAFSAIGLVIGLFFVPEPVFYAIGVVLGAAMSVFKIFLLHRAVKKLTQGDIDDKKAAQNLMRLGYMSRYLLTAAVFIAAVLLFGTWGFVGVFVGTVAMTLSAIAVRIFIKNDDN